MEHVAAIDQGTTVPKVGQGGVEGADDRVEARARSQPGQRRLALTGGREPDPDQFSSPAARAIAIEHRWLSRLLQAGLNVHHLDSEDFTLLDATAGYWVNERIVRVRDMRQVADCLTALGEHDVEVRLTASLWPYVDAVVAADGDFQRHPHAQCPPPADG